MKIWLGLLIPLLASSIVLPDIGGPTSGIPGTLVPFASLSSCPTVPQRLQAPLSAHDVRPDDFKVVMALGDSITAGLLAKSSRDPVPTRSFSLLLNDEQLPLHTKPSIADEYRGVSYTTGYDPGAITIASILSHYSPNITGASVGHHPPIACTRPWCDDTFDKDGLNAAVSGSVAASLIRQVSDYLIPRLEYSGVRREDWKYVNIGIGANDLCNFCLSPNVTETPVAGSPSQFAKGIKDAVELLRKHVPHVIVNIIGVMRVSAIYDLTLRDPYCSGPVIPPVVPHLPLECSCALLPGPAGDFTRQRMDQLANAYDEAVFSLLIDWEAEDDPSFGATWQPSSVIDLTEWPITALSPVDCFHPSEAAHRRVAAGFWNRLTLGLEGRSLPVEWEEDVMIRCLEEGDRIQVGIPR